MKVIPAIDLKDGRCVRLYQGDFNDVTEYSEYPALVATEFAAMGFDYLHVVDLDGAQYGSQRNQSLVRELIDASHMSIQLGGGIRDATTIKLWFDAGVKRCVIGSAAVTDPALVNKWIGEFSADRIVVALDVAIDDGGMPRPATHGWTQTADTTLWACIDAFTSNGLRHLLCTDIGRDGALSGPNLDLYTEIVRRYPEVHLQASGGVRHIEDLRLAAHTGAAAAITGRALLDGRISTEEIGSFQRSE